MAQAAQDVGLQRPRLDSQKARLTKLLLEFATMGCGGHDVFENFEGEAPLSICIVADVLKEHPELTRRLCYRVSMFHVGVLCRYPTLKKLVFEHTPYFNMDHGHLPRVARKLLDHVSSVDARLLLQTITLPAWFTTERFKLRGHHVSIIEGALLLVHQVTAGKANPFTTGNVDLIAGAFRLCRDVLSLVWCDHPKFVALKLVNVDNGCCPQSTPYGMAVALFIRLHGKDAMQRDNSRAHKELSAKGDLARIKAEILFDHHSDLLVEMEESPEVQEAYADLPHPKLATGMLFMVALCLLAFANITVANLPYVMDKIGQLEVRVKVARAAPAFVDRPSWWGFIGCVFAFFAMITGLVVHHLSDSSFMKWTNGSAMQLTRGEKCKRCAIQAIELACVLVTGVTLWLLWNICSSTTSWNETEVEAMQRAAGCLLRVAMMMCLVPIVHGSSYCGHELLSCGSCIFTFVGGFVLAGAVALSTYGRGKELNVAIGAHTVVLAAAVCSVVASFGAQGKD